MLLRTDYIILRKVPFQESSLVVSGLSPDYGRLDFLLKGARGSGAKKFPYAGLFRELSVEFQENRGGGLLYMKSQEPKSNFDAIANRPENYIRLCEWVQFLLKHTRPMLELPRTYAALRLAVSRLITEPDGAFPLAAAELVFLHESGFVPEVPPDDLQRGRTLNGLLDYALDPAAPMPGLTAEYRRKLMDWIRALSRCADSF